MGIGNFQPPQNQYPWPIDKKFGTVENVGEGNPYTNFGTNPCTAGFWANSER